jgi:hypothetical protein
MSSTIEIYLGTTQVEGLPILSAPESPLKFIKQIGDQYIDLYFFQPIDEVLNGEMTLHLPDFEIIESELNVKIQDALGFKPKSALLYKYRTLTREKVSAFKILTDYLARKGVSFYLMVENEHLISGFNPKTGTEIINNDLTDVLKQNQMLEE